MMSSNFGGRCGFNRNAGTGARKSLSAKSWRSDTSRHPEYASVGGRRSLEEPRWDLRLWARRRCALFLVCIAHLLKVYRSLLSFHSFEARLDSICAASIRTIAFEEKPTAIAGLT
jgi:hypothetical protein